jgi:WD40 repeat protein
MATRLFCCFVLLSSLWPVAQVRSQEACPVPAYTQPARTANIFSEQQENDLGDAVGEALQRSYRVIDDEVTTNLRRIGQKLLSQLPLSDLRIQFYLVDYPEANAFSFPGGRIYVSRKMVAFCRNEDELAGVVAHELGHVITRHSAIDFTFRLKKVLGITAVGDRKDIFEKFNQYNDNVSRNPGILRDIVSIEDKQIVADHVSLYLAKRAGYAPEAVVQLWDRQNELGGKTGSSLSDFFGITKPEQKRLREMQRLIEQLPAACSGPRPDSTAQQFDEWKTAVIEYSGLGHKESLPLAEWKRELRPRLRGNITHMRFSGDGKYLLAQDSSSIFVLSREPFKFLFQIEAQAAFPAQFTPDSQSIVFHTQGLRVETWNIPEERRTDLQELAIRYDCVNTKLSPDAKHLACMDTERRLTIFNVADGSQVFQKNANVTSVVNQVAAFGLYLSLLLNSSQLEFSPDGRYFLGVDAARTQTYSYDFIENKPIKLPDSITSRMNHNFAFMSENRFVGVAGKLGVDSAVVRFPSGEVLHKFQIGLSTMYPATKGDYLIMRPIQKYAAGVMDLAQNKVFMASNDPAIDLYDKTFVAERQDGVLYLFQTDKELALGKAELPQGLLPRPTAVSLSADMNWLAVSETSRGAIWDLRKGERVFLARNFQGAQFAADNTLIMDLPKSGAEKRRILRLDPAGSSVKGSIPLADREISQEGLYLIEYRKDPTLKLSYNTVLAVSSSETGKELWARTYSKGLPRINCSSEDDKAVLIWSASSEFVKDESKANPELKKKIESEKEREGDFYIHIAQASTGNLIGKVYVETGRGSFRLRWAEAAGDYLTLYDNKNRLLIYSISNGKRIGQLFGSNGSISPANQLLAVENKIGAITIYSLPSMEEVGKLVFAHPLVYVKFSKDGKHLFALTNDQSAYFFSTETVISKKAGDIQAEKRSQENSMGL